MERTSTARYHVSELRRRWDGVCLAAAAAGTIRENILYGPAGGMRERTRGRNPGTQLTQAALWEEVKDRLDNRHGLSAGSSSVCVSPQSAVEPKCCCLMNHLGSGSISTRKVEDSLSELKQQYTIIIVPTASSRQPCGGPGAFFLMGDLVEYAPGTELFTRPVTSDRRLCHRRFG